MIVMPADNAKMEVGYLAGRYPGRIGWLIGPSHWREPREWLPYALDNGRYAASQGKEWSEALFLKMCEKASKSYSPLWVVVPDVVGDRNSTLREWDKWASRLEQFGWPLAMAVQDGMTPDDVPQEAAVVFVGGTTTWKRRTLANWCKVFPRVHAGRIHNEKWLWRCHELGVESCDGTGWFKGGPKRIVGLCKYLDRSSQGLEKSNYHRKPLWK